MKKIFAIPTENEKLCAHFGHCEKFAIIETNGKKVLKEKYLTPPEHEEGVYPGLLAQLGVDVVITGGMGPKAQQLFAQKSIEVYMGVERESPVKLVEQYLKGKLEAGVNQCDH